MVRRIVCFALVCAFLVSSTAAYAGEAWPWVVGGVAGILTLSAMSNSRNRNREVHHYYYSQPTAVSQVERQVVRERVWHQGGYDIDGTYHPGYYGYRDIVY